METFNKLPIILDGATGTEMIKRGYQLGDCLERWILDDPNPLKALQERYISAGSQIICAPTFGANRVSLSRHGLESKVREYNLQLAELSLTVSGGRALVSGDLSPTGLTAEPYGDTPKEEIEEIYSEQVRALDEAGVDLFAIETQISGQEALSALRAVKDETDKPATVSFTCNAQGSSFFGERMTDLLLMMQNNGASAFGINCCGDFDLIEKLVAELCRLSQIPIIVKPNAGPPVMIDGVAHYHLTPENMANRMYTLRIMGAGMLGGCCGTDERHILAINRMIG